MQSQRQSGAQERAHILTEGGGGGEEGDQNLICKKDLALYCLFLVRSRFYDGRRRRRFVCPSSATVDYNDTAKRGKVKIECIALAGRYVVRNSYLNAKGNLTLDS